jgi:hypothetical protein
VAGGRQQSAGRLSAKPKAINRAPPLCYRSPFFDLTVNPSGFGTARDFEVVVNLQVQPELGGRAEKARQAQCGIRSDRASV